MTTMVFDLKVYAVINTTNYNEDGIASIQVARGAEECDALGWEPDTEGINQYTHEVTKVRDLQVGEIIEHWFEKGAFIMRVA